MEIVGLTILFCIPIIMKNQFEHTYNLLQGISIKTIVFLIALGILLSFPWWLDECISINNISFFRRALGWYAFSTLIKAPIYEELIFRGIILSMSRDNLSDINAAVLNGLLFSSIHLPVIFLGNFFTILFILLGTFLFGFILSLFQLRYNMILIPVITHSVVNLIIIELAIIEPIIANNVC